MKKKKSNQKNPVKNLNYSFNFYDTDLDDEDEEDSDWLFGKLDIEDETGVRCECGGDKVYGVNANLHSSWCPKNTK